MTYHILPPTTQKVSLHTCSSINESIRKHTTDMLEIYKDRDNDSISDRISYLNEEWDTDRILEADIGLIVLAGSILGCKISKSWFVLTGIAGAFLLQHALQGWCPPLPLLRRFGIRTSEEIYNEKTVLKMIRKDFLQETNDVAGMLSCAEKQ